MTCGALCLRTNRDSLFSTRTPNPMSCKCPTRAVHCRLSRSVFRSATAPIFKLLFFLCFCPACFLWRLSLIWLNLLTFFFSLRLRLCSCPVSLFLFGAPTGGFSALHVFAVGLPPDLALFPFLCFLSVLLSLARSVPRLLPDFVTL
jgi:hypothetical protein